MLNSTPHISSEKSQVSITSWKKLKPLSIEEILKNTEGGFDFDDVNIEFKEVKLENHSAIGLYMRNGNTINGIARRVFSHT